MSYLYLILIFLEIVALFFLSRRVNRGIYRLFYQFTKRRSISTYLFAVLYLPGTFIHEASHFMAALFLLVPVGKLQLIPELKDEGGISLGSVSIAKTDPLRRFLIGVAPFIFGVVIIFSVLYYVSIDQFVQTWWGNILAGFIVFEVANSMFASKKDMEGAFLLLAFLFFVSIFFIVLGARIPQGLIDIFLRSSTGELLKSICLFLLVPVIVDAVALSLLKKIRF